MVNRIKFGALKFYSDHTGLIYDNNVVILRGYCYFKSGRLLPIHKIRTLEIDCPDLEELLVFKINYVVDCEFNWKERTFRITVEPKRRYRNGRNGRFCYGSSCCRI